MNYEQLHDLAMHLGLLVSDNPTMLTLKTRITRASI